MTQEHLFNPRTTEVPVCPSCGTTRVNLCRHDARIAHSEIDPYTPRPKGCLNSSQNRDGIPYA